MGALCLIEPQSAGQRVKDGLGDAGQVAALEPRVVVDARALSSYMGHASVTITYDRYGHLMPGNEEEAAALLDAYLERSDTLGRLAALDG